jgi:hypothetical protein
MAAGYEISAAIDPTGGKSGAPIYSPTIIDFGNGQIEAPSTLSTEATDEPVATAATAGSRADSQGAAGSTGSGGIPAGSSGGYGEYVLIGVAALAVILFIHHK